MKKLIPFLSLLLLAVSCNEVHEEYLYDENDRDWALVQSLATKLCKNDSRIFNELTKRSNFSRHFSNNTYYKVAIKKDNGAEYDDFIKIDSIDGDSMVIRYYGSQTNADSRKYTYTKTQNADLIAAISNGVCDTRDDYKFSSSKLDSSSSLNFSDWRKDGTDDVYEKVTDAFKASTAMPLALILWNKTRTTIKKSSGNDPADPKSDTYSVTEITQKACKDDSDCAQAEETYNWDFAAGTISIDPDAYNRNELSSEIIKAD